MSEGAPVKTVFGARKASDGFWQGCLNAQGQKKDRAFGLTERVGALSPTGSIHHPVEETDDIVSGTGHGKTFETE